METEVDVEVDVKNSGDSVTPSGSAVVIGDSDVE